MPLLPWPLRPVPPAFGAAPLALAAALLAAASALAVPRLDLTPYPAPDAGQSRWVIQLPGVLPPNPEPSLSPSPADWRVELIVGREVLVDCNRQVFSGRIASETLAGQGVKVYRVGRVGPMASTRMACPPGEPKRKAFVRMGGKPFVVPYNVSQPIVVYAPKDLEVRWRLWKAAREQRPALRL
ncbi:MAG: ecotin family protein [Cyanobium sp.]